MTGPDGPTTTTERAGRAIGSNVERAFEECGVIQGAYGDHMICLVLCGSAVPRFERR